MCREWTYFWPSTSGTLRGSSPGPRRCARRTASLVEGDLGHVPRREIEQVDVLSSDMRRRLRAGITMCPVGCASAAAPGQDLPCFSAEGSDMISASRPAGTTPAARYLCCARGAFRLDRGWHSTWLITGTTSHSSGCAASGPRQKFDKPISESCLPYAPSRGFGIPRPCRRRTGVWDHQVDVVRAQTLERRRRRWAFENELRLEEDLTLAPSRMRAFRARRHALVPTFAVSMSV